MTDFHMIVAAARNGVIGLDGDMPWHVPEDLKHFKAVTMGCPVVMGRRTWDSLPRRPLPGRTNYVLTRSASWSAEGAVIVSSADGLASSVARHDPEAETCFIMGGATLYESFYPLASKVCLTRLELEPEGDTWFQLPETQGFVLESRGDAMTSVNGVGYVFETWKRV